MTSRRNDQTVGEVASRRGACRRSVHNSKRRSTTCRTPQVRIKTGFMVTIRVRL